MPRPRLTAKEVLQRYEELPAFVEMSLTDVNQVGRFGERPLHVAAVRGGIDEVDALLAAGADVDGLGELGNTPLHEAVGQRHAHVVRRLVEAGARRDIRNVFGETALDLTRLGDRDEISEILQRSDDHGTLRH